MKYQTDAGSTCLTLIPSKISPFCSRHVSLPSIAIIVSETYIYEHILVIYKGLACDMIASQMQHRGVKMQIEA